MTNNIKNTPNAKTIFKSVLNIQSTADVWNKEHYEGAVKGLYAILRDVYEQVALLRNETPEFRTEFTTLAKNKNFPYNKGTSIEVIALRVVFNITDANNKRPHRYARALTVARTDNIQPEDFVNWLTQIGGIDNVESKDAEEKRLAREAKEAEKLAKLIDAAENLVSIKPMTAAKPSSGVSSNLSVALVRHNGDKKEIVGHSDNEALIQSMLHKLKEVFEKEVSAANSNEARDAVQQTKEQVRSEVTAQAG